MSLLIHLPLINDTNNQGLLEVPDYSYNTLSQQDDGKIGIHCYNGAALYHFNQDPLGNEWSIALWFKKTSNWNSSNDILICKNNNGTTSQFYLSVYGSGSYLNLGINGNWSAGVGQVSYTFETNTWYHIAVTYDGTNYAMYVNGEKIDSGQYESTQYTGCYNLGFNCRSGSEDGTSVTSVASKRLNDVKIFSHCLSEKEISELKKTLILHYPLDGNNGTLTNENLIINSGQSVESAKSSNGSAYTNANAHLFSDYGTELFINNTTDEFTISYDYEVFGAESQEGHSAYIYNQVNGTQVSETLVYLTSASETGHASFTAKLNATQAEHSNRPFTLRFRLRYAVDDAYFIIKNVKLEKGSVATPWCPSSEDALYTALGYNDGIEYDTSGYKNNATGANNLSYSLDSPRYLASAVCNYNNGLTIPKIFSDTCNNQHMSFAFWLKRTADFEVYEEDIYNGIAHIYIRKDYNNNPYRLFIGWNHATDDSVKVNTWHTGYTVPLDTWVHIVITFDSGVLKAYINGTLFGTSDRSSSGIYIQGNHGTSLGNITGKLSDFRVYANCLTDTEIQKLYTVSASIDSNGNAYSAAYVEG